MGQPNPWTTLIVRLLTSLRQRTAEKAFQVQSSGQSSNWKYLYFWRYPNSLIIQNGRGRGKLPCPKPSSIRSAVSIEPRLVTDIDGHGTVASTALAYRRGRLTGSRDGSARCLAVYRRRTCAPRTAVHREWSPGWRTRRTREQPAETGIGKKVKVPILDYRAEDF